MLSAQDIIKAVLELLDEYTGPDLHVEQALTELRQQILEKFEHYV